MKQLPKRLVPLLPSFLAVVLATVWALLVGASSIQAMQEDEWEVMRIFITDPKQLSILVPPNYQPVEIEDLARDLAKEARRREAALLDVPKLEEAIYVARLEKGTLLSEQSRWVFSGKTTSQPMNVGDVSIALRRALGILPNKDQLLDYQLITAGGDLQLNLPGGRIERWFGFSVLPSDSAKQSFDLQLPIALSARMLIATPANILLQSKNVVVEKIEDPIEYLPKDWSTAEPSLFGGSSGRQWWLLNLSGVARLELSAQALEEPSQNWFKHTLRTADIDYIASDGMLDVKANFKLASDPSGSPVRIRLASDLRISSVLVGGVSAQWRIHPSLAGDSTLVEIEGQFDRSSTLLVEVAASQAFLFEAESEIALPELAIAESFSIRGRTRVFSDENLVVDHLSSSEYRSEMSSSILGSRPTGQLSSLHWTLNWLGVNPKVQASFSHRVQSWTGRSLTRFVLQTDWLSAVCRIQLESKNVDANEIKMSVGTGWFVDKVSLVGNAPSDLQAKFIEGGTEQEPLTDIVVSWEQKRKSLFCELEVVAHRPQKTVGETIRLFSRRLLTIPDADQIDNYVIEPSGRYQVQSRADFLRFQLQPLDLPMWQQQLLPQLSDKWIFQGIRRVVPPIDLVAAQGSYATQAFTLVKKANHSDQQALAVDYWIRVTPISGTVSSIALTAPNSVDPTTLRWEQVSVGAPSLPVVGVVTPRSDGASTIELELQQPHATAFVLRCTTLHAALQEKDYSVAIFGLPQAVTSESLLITPRELSHFRSNTALEVLPVSACCDDFGNAPWLDGTDSQLLQDHVAARLDAGVDHTVHLAATGELQKAAGWIWDEHIEHRIEAGARRSHSVRWEIEVMDDPQFELKLPEGWRVESMTMNGAPVRLVDQKGATIQVLLPTLERSSLVLECSSRSPSHAWLTHEELQRPEVVWEVFTSNEIFHVPPNKVVCSLAPASPISRRLIERLIPSQWWRWLSPESLSSENDLANSPRWTAIAVAPEQTNGPWIVDRSAFAGMALGSVILAVVFFWVALRRSVRLSWLLCGSLAVSLVIVPSHWVAPLQLLLLAAILAALLRLAQVIVRPIPADRGKRAISRAVKLSVIRDALVVLGLILPASTGLAQNNSALERPTDSTQAKLQPPQIFGVLIPVDEAGNVVSTYAYVPPLLHKLLSDPNSSWNGGIATRLLSADYALRTNPTNSLERELVQEFTAEFRVFVGRPDSELRLPFLLSELPISRSEINGQADLFGDNSVRQESSAVIFRAKMPGTYLLKLYFKPLVVVDDHGQARLQVQIPAIPSANLRILSDAVTRTEVKSIGRQQRSGNELNVALGALDELDCRWISGQDGFVSPQSVAVSSNLWIHANGNQLAAAAMLRIQNPAGLPELFHIVADNNWEPVGSQWRDVELISSESTTLSNRRIYTVRLTSEFLLSAKTEAVIGMLMTPKTKASASTIPLPFLSLQEVGQNATRALTWSASGELLWGPEGIGPLIPAVEEKAWGELALSKEFVSYRVSSSSPTSSLQRKTQPAIELVNEFNQVHLSLAEARLQYRAQWPQGKATSGLRFDVPSNVRVESVLVNGNATDYQLGRQTGHDVLLVSPRSEIVSIDSVDLVLTYPITLGRKTPLRRVMLLESNPTSSIFVLMRSAGLECQIEPKNKQQQEQLTFDRVTSRPKELLANLEVLVGQTELKNGFRESGELPIEFTLNRRTEPVAARAVIYVERNEQGGWVGRLESEWKAGGKPLDFAYFELPSSLRDAVDAGPFPRRLIPTGDSSRMVLCVMLPDAVDGTNRLSLKFALSTTPSSQSISIPKILLLAEQPVMPVLALPRKIDSQTVVWSKGGPPVDAGWRDPFSSQESSAFEYFDRDPVQMQASWRTLDRIDRTSRIVLTKVAMDSITASSAVGVVNYWVQPRGQLELHFELPDRTQVIGAKVGTRNASLLTATNHSVSVLLQPNYLPVNVSLLVRWERRDQEPLPIPKPKLGTASGETQANLKMVVELPDAQWHLARTEPGLGPIEFTATTWASTITNSMSVANGLTAAEQIGWLQSWQPAWLGLEEDDLVNLDEVTPQSNDADALQNANQKSVTVHEFWLNLCEQLSIDPASVALSTEQSLRPQRGAAGRRLYLVDSDRIHLRPHQEISNLTPQLIAAGLLALVVLLSLRLGLQLREIYFKLLAAHPWVYWVQLASLAWFFIPAVWPSIVILITAIGMAASQFVDGRRATQYR